MSFLNKPMLYPQPLGIQDQQTANNVMGTPVSWVAGTRNLAATWISPVYNLQAFQAGGGKKGGGGKGKNGGGGPSTYNYYGTVAGGICPGVVQGLNSVLMDGECVWPQANGWSIGQTISPGEYFTYDGQVWVAQSNMSGVSTDGNAPGNVDGDGNPYWVQFSYTPTEGSMSNIGGISGENVDAGTNYDDITIIIPNTGTAAKKNSVGAPTVYGKMRIYWGSQTAADPNLSTGAPGNPPQHPAYVGMCYIVLINFFLGQGTNTAPNLELVLTRAVQQSVIASAPGSQDGQVNLAVAAAEILTSDNTLGLPASWVDEASFSATAAAFAATPSLYYGSPLIDSQETVQSVLEKITTQNDAYFRFNPATQCIEMGWYPHGVYPTPGTYVTLTQTSLTDRAKFTADGWSKVMSRATVQYNDRVLNYQQNTVKADDPRAFEVIGQVRNANVDLPWVVRGAQALALASESLRTIGSPQLTAEVSVRRELGRDIRPGDYVLLDIDLEPNSFTLEAFFRVKERTIPRTGPIKLKLLKDPTLNPIPYVNSPAPVLPGTLELEPISCLRVIADDYGIVGESPAMIAESMKLAPTQLLPKGAEHVIVLAQRPDLVSLGFELYFDTSDTTGTFISLGVQSGFAAMGTLAANVATTDTTINVTFPVAPTVVIGNGMSNNIDQSLIGLSPGDGPNSDDQLLLIIIASNYGSLANDSMGRGICEVMTVSEQTYNTGGYWEIAVTRGQCGTWPLAFNDGDNPQCEVWLIWKSQLVAFSSTEFPQIRANMLATVSPASGYFRVANFSRNQQTALADITSVEFSFPPKSPDGPVIRAISPANGILEVSGAVYASGVDEGFYESVQYFKGEIVITAKDAPIGYFAMKFFQADGNPMAPGTLTEADFNVVTGAGTLFNIMPSGTNPAAVSGGVAQIHLEFDQTIASTAWTGESNPSTNGYINNIQLGTNSPGKWICAIYAQDIYGLNGAQLFEIVLNAKQG